ncbi:hypothetical protein [Streptomyces sp. NPDC047315]|uniref:hypothetical protein n=1 Tax=Streptomyces sp. NPDC047315 TaxID=3155142 RepID=UPI00340A72EC
MPRRVVVTALLPQQPDPEPAYPQYADLLREARVRGRGPIGAQSIARMEDVVRRRGASWCTAVLGRPFPGLRGVPSVDGFMLIAADERGLDPALPESVVKARAAEEARRQEREAQAAAKLEAEQQRWALIAGVAPVVFTVRANTRHTGVRGALRHVTAGVDLLSGRSRLHKAGMGLCELAARTNALHLGEPLKVPPTCRRCIEYAGKVRPLTALAPPTEAEAALLQLIASGVVFTLRPARSQPGVRDISQRSRGTRGGALGRKVDAAVRKLQKKGWAVADDKLSATETGHHGHCWRLTEAGTAALEE